MDKKTIARHQHNRDVFCSINSIRSLCSLLKMDQRRLTLLVRQPPYKVFTVPKKDGGERIIEAPGTDLKGVLGRLNRYLQSVYYFEKSSAAYGFIVGVHDDNDRRNVVTNARKHAGRAYLLNVDLTDFFHAVSRERIVEIFQSKPFQFKRDLPDLLAGLTTYQGRLPMGTPTSPVLSNFACRELDARLTTYSGNMLWVYTRYADDMSFSSNKPIDADKVDSVRAIIREEGFEVNERKLKVFGPEDDKIVTGLLVTDKVTLAPDYLSGLADDIHQLQNVLLIQNEQGQLSTRWVEQFKKNIIGRLNFAGFVLKRNNESYMELKDAYYTAINPPQEDFGAVSWRGFPYNL
ncbi:MAG: RNA-directed DNA polymerase [Phaeodactylibacter sp.]|nr:RNA-directed DNA polymerase [Phaeodactylibacter sp.]